MVDTRSISCRLCPILLGSRRLSFAEDGLGRMVRSRSILFRGRLLPFDSLVEAIGVVVGRGPRHGR